MSSSVISASIETFQHQGDLYTKKIEIEKRRIAELDSKLKNAKSRLIEARRSMGGVNEAQNQMRKKQRQMRVLENQLEKIQLFPQKLFYEQSFLSPSLLLDTFLL